MASRDVNAVSGVTQIKRRTALTILPLALAGLAQVAKGNVTPNNTHTVLDERAERYALRLITDASTSGISSSFVAFAQHVSTLAAAGDCKSIRTVTEFLTNYLYREHSQYDETREIWLCEELANFADVVDMDDENLTDDQRHAASLRSSIQHHRRKGERAEMQAAQRELAELQANSRNYWQKYYGRDAA